MYTHKSWALLGASDSGCYAVWLSMTVYETQCSNEGPWNVDHATLKGLCPSRSSIELPDAPDTPTRVHLKVSYTIRAWFFSSPTVFICWYFSGYLFVFDRIMLSFMLLEFKILCKSLLEIRDGIFSWWFCDGFQHKSLS